MTAAPSISERVEQNLAIVATVIHAMALPPHVDFPALKSAGLKGLLEAANKFDPEEGCTFAGLAFRVVRFRIRDEIRRLSTVTRRGVLVGKQIAEAENELAHELGRAPTDDELARELGISTDSLSRKRTLAAGDAIFSIDAERGSDTDATFHDVIPEAENALDRADAETVLGYVRQAVDMLEDDRQRDIVTSSFLKRQTLSVIAKRYGCTESRVAQIRAQAIGHVRRHFTKIMRMEGQPDFALPEISNRPARKKSMSKANRIIWNDNELAVVAKAFLVARVSDPLGSISGALAKAEAAALPPDRRRNILSAAFCPRLVAMIDAEASTLCARLFAPSHAHTERTPEPTLAAHV